MALVNLISIPENSARHDAACLLISKEFHLCFWQWKFRGKMTHTDLINAITSVEVEKKTKKKCLTTTFEELLERLKKKR